MRQEASPLEVLSPMRPLFVAGISTWLERSDGRLGPFELVKLGARAASVRMLLA